MTINFKLAPRWAWKFSCSFTKVAMQLELWHSSVDKVWSLGIYWNRLLHPSTWWWLHNNGAVKGKDNCYDWTLNIFILSFGYTNFALWRYKK